MEGFSLTNIETTNNVFSNQGLTENRVQALKSLALLLLNEVKLLESLNLKKNDLLTDGRFSLSEEVEKFEIELIRLALVQAKGSQRVAARLLQTKTSTLCAKIKRYGIEPNGMTFIPRIESDDENFVSVKAFG
jgi:transcriptional regulator with GAF, ATPase, and Fis domain